MSRFSTTLHILRQPVIWAWVFYIAAYEAASFNYSGGVFSGRAFGNLLDIPAACTCVLYVALIFGSDKIGPLRAKPWLIPTTAGIGFLSLLLCAGIANAAATPHAVLAGTIGSSVLYLSITVLGLAALECFAYLSLVWATRAIVLSSAIAALIAPFYLVSNFFSVAVPLLLCVVCLVLANKSTNPSGASDHDFAARDTHQRAANRMACGTVSLAGPAPAQLTSAIDVQGAPAASSITDAGTSKPKPQRRLPWQLVAGFFLVSTCFGFVESGVFQNPIGTIELITTATKLIAIAVFAAIVFNAEDTGYPLLARTIATLCAAALVLILLEGTHSALAAGILLTGYSIFEATFYLLSVNIGSSSHAGPVRVYCAFSLIDTIGYLCGTALFTVPSVHAGACVAALAILMVITGIWVFTEKGINDFLWTFSDETAREGTGMTPNRTNEDPERKPSGQEHAPTFQEKTRTFAEANDLSPRETDVLQMYATGRSATFIADALFLSSNTVRTHIKHIYAKADVHSRQELITRIDQQAEHQTEQQDK